MTLLHARVVTGLVVVLVAASSASGSPARPQAGPTREASTEVLTVDGVPGKRVIVVEPPVRDRRVGTAALVSRVLFLDRCSGAAGCRVLSATGNDAAGGYSTVPKRTESTIDEFKAGDGRIGAPANTEWNSIVQCIKEVYSPFSVTVTDQKPAAGPYHRAIIAGDPSDIGFASDVLGVAPLANDCTAIDNAMSFTFANLHPPITPGETPSQADIRKRMLDICWTAAQESAHAFGLDHQFEYYPSGRSACNDPMTYRQNCGGQKFFRNEPARCGETETRACQCGGQQNSHQKLLSSFGPATPITRNPTITMIDPTSNSSVLNRTVTAMAGSQRGIARVDVLLNGFRWVQLEGAGFGNDGQPNPSQYVGTIPSDVPNSIIDVKMIAYDDIGTFAETPTVTVTRGAPCSSADSCLKGQKCETGRCFWDPPQGELGDSCGYPQFCKSNLCTGPVGAVADDLICSQECAVGNMDNCPNGLVCTGANPAAVMGICLFAPESGGCCSVDRGDGGWAHLGLGAAVLALVLRRRRPARA